MPDWFCLCHITIAKNFTVLASYYKCIATYEHRSSTDSVFHPRSLILSHFRWGPALDFHTARTCVWGGCLVPRGGCRTSWSRPRWTRWPADWPPRVRGGEEALVRRSLCAHHSRRATGRDPAPTRPASSSTWTGASRVPDKHARYMLITILRTPPPPCAPSLLWQGRFLIYSGSRTARERPVTAGMRAHGWRGEVANKSSDRSLIRAAHLSWASCWGDKTLLLAEPYDCLSAYWGQYVIHVDLSNTRRIRAFI